MNEVTTAATGARNWEFASNQLLAKIQYAFRY
jgi:hypothetical protein